MATFSTNSDVIRRIEGGTDTLAVLTGVAPYDATVVDYAREKAAGTILARLGTRYLIPADLSVYPVVVSFLREIELDLVEHELWSRVREDMPKRVANKGKAALDLLAAIAEGKAVLPAGAELPSSTEKGAAATVVGSERVMTRDNLDGVF